MPVTDAQILEKYEEYAYPGATKLHKIIDDPDVTLKRVRGVIAQQLSEQLHKKKTKKVEAHMTTLAPNIVWLADLLDMSNFASTNNGYKWILLIIDVFTRRAFARPMKTKTADNVENAFEELFLARGQPLKLITDSGSEFTNAKLKELLDSEKIYHETVEPGYHPALGIIDRLSRTIKEKIHKRFTAKNTTDWLTTLGNIMVAYNNTPHSALGMIAPRDALDPLNKEKIRDLNIEKNQRPKHNFSVGQLVRRRVKKPLFSKGYTDSWSATTYTIKEIKGVNAVLDNDDTVKLNDLQVVVAPPEPAPEVTEVQVEQKKAKVSRKLKQAGVERGKILVKGRPKRQKKIMQGDEIYY